MNFKGLRPDGDKAMLESVFSARDSARLAAAPEVVEVSAGFAVEHLASYLWKLIPHMEEGFGRSHVRQLVSAADSLHLNAACKATYHVVWQGRKETFRIILYKYKPDTVGLYFKAPWPIARVAQEEVTHFYTDRPKAESETQRIRPASLPQYASEAETVPPGS